MNDKPIQYDGKAWTVMNKDVNTTHDNLLLPTYVKMTITIVRKVSEDERKEYYSEAIRQGILPPIKYSEYIKLS